MEAANGLETMRASIERGVCEMVYDSVCSRALVDTRLRSLETTSTGPTLSVYGSADTSAMGILIEE